MPEAKGISGRRGNSSDGEQSDIFRLSMNIIGVRLETTAFTLQTTYIVPQITSFDPGMWAIYLDGRSPDSLA